MLFHCSLDALFRFERYLLFSQGYWQQDAGRFQSLLHSWIFCAGLAGALKAAKEDTSVSKVTDCELGDRGLFRKEQFYLSHLFCFQAISVGLPDVGLYVGLSSVELWSYYLTVAANVRSPSATAPVWPYGVTSRHGDNLSFNTLCIIYIYIYRERERERERERVFICRILLWRCKWYANLKESVRITIYWFSSDHIMIMYQLLMYKIL
jgi:hypothetical protein